MDDRPPQELNPAAGQQPASGADRRPTSVDEFRVERWERRAEVPLLLLALAFMVAYAWPILNPRLSPDVLTFLRTVSWTVWGAFALDFAIRIGLAENRRHYALEHWYDVAMIVMPALRPLRLLRLVAFLRILNRTALGTLAGRVTIYLAGTALLSIFLGSLAVLQAERGAPRAHITSFGDALWWACSTVTTVGYGDYFPVTTQGRAVAVLLMLIGIATVGAVTAAVASGFVSAAKRHEN